MMKLHKLNLLSLLTSLFWSETKQTSPNELFQQGDEEKYFIDKEVDYIIFQKMAGRIFLI